MRLDRINVQQPARGMDNVGRLRHGLDGSGLVVGEHHRDQRWRAAVKQGAKMIKVDKARARDPDAPDPLGREPSPGDDRGVLDRRDQQPLNRGRGAAPQAGRQGQHVGFGAAGGEHHVLRPGRHGGRDQRPRLLDQAARLAALGMDRGGLPLISHAAAIAALASGRSGVVAFQSR